MKCSEMKNEILLMHSGELPETARIKVCKHLEECENCRTLHADLEKLSSAFQNERDVQSPSESVMHIIRSAAEDKVLRAGTFFSQRSLQVMAYAAAIAVVICGWVLYEPKEETQAISEVAALIEIIAEDDQEGYLEEQMQIDPLERLADQLLILEGFGEEDYIEFTVTIEDEEPQTTDLLFRRTLSFPLRRCV